MAYSPNFLRLYAVQLNSAHFTIANMMQQKAFPIFSTFTKKKYLQMLSSDYYSFEIKHMYTVLPAHTKKLCFFNTHSRITCKKNHFKRCFK